MPQSDISAVNICRN